MGWARLFLLGVLTMLENAPMKLSSAFVSIFATLLFAAFYFAILGLFALPVAIVSLVAFIGLGIATWIRDRSGESL